MSAHKVRLADIVLDDTTQAREGHMDGETIADYVCRLDESEPPIIDLFGEKPYYIGDGHYRCHALAGAGREYVMARIHKGSVLDALCFGFRHNKEHGLRFRNIDKRHAIKKALASGGHELTDRELSNKLDCSHTLVWNVRHENGKVHAEIPLEGLEPKAKKMKKRRATRIKNAAKVPVNTHRFKRGDADEDDDAALTAVNAHLDGLGQPVPSALRDVMGDKIVGDWHDMLRQIRGRIDSVSRWNPYLQVEQVTVACDNLLEAVRAALPYAVHADCAGRGCERCRTVGWVTKWRHEELERER